MAPLRNAGRLDFASWPADTANSSITTRKLVDSWRSEFGAGFLNPVRCRAQNPAPHLCFRSSRVTGRLTDAESRVAVLRQTDNRPPPNEK